MHSLNKNRFNDTREAIPIELRTAPLDENKIEASLCRSSFYYFVKTFWPEVVPEKFIENWHICYICQEMQKLAERVFAGEHKLYDEIFNVPPGTSKTTICSVLFPAWVWIRMQSARLICCSFSEKLSLRSSSQTRRVVKCDKYRLLFPEVELRSDQDTKSEFANTKGGVRFAIGSGTQVMGSHAHFIIIDDPIDPKSVLSELLLESINNWIKEQLSGRKVDKLMTVTILVMQRLHQCLLPGTRVFTPDGGKFIETLDKGDLVFGSQGWQEIKETSTSWYDGQVFGVQLYGHPDICWTTDNHRYLTKRGWIRADELRSNDSVRFPVVTHHHSIPWEQIQYAEVPKSGTGNFNGSRTGKIKKNKLKKLVALGLTNYEIANRLGCHRNTIQCYIWKYKIRRIADRNPIFGDKHLSDPIFWRLIGYWLAEGNLHFAKKGHGIGTVFSFGYDEQDYVDDVINIFAKLGVKATQQPASDGSCIRVEAWSRQLSVWLYKHFAHGAHNKLIPEFVYSLPRECREELMDGWIAGDGNYMKEKRFFNGTTVSENLARGMQRLALSLGNPCYITGGNGRRKEIIGLPNKAFSSGKARNVRFRDGEKPSNKSKGEMGKDCCWYKIRKIAAKPYEGPVYDITTPSHDFVVGNATVHNSDPTAMMGAKKKVKWVKIPATDQFDIQPVGLRKYYTRVPGLRWKLMDPNRLKQDALDEVREGPRGEYVYAGQYGQDPVPPGGGMFKTPRIVMVEPLAPIPRFKSMVRFWDKAGTLGGGAYTVGVKMGLTSENRIFILDVIRVQLDSWEREKLIRQTAHMDGKHVVVGLEQEGASGGKESAENTVRRLIGYKCKVINPKGKKEERADPFSTQVNAGNVYMLKSHWNAIYIDEMKYFPMSTFKDQIDASSGCLTVLLKGLRKVGGMRKGATSLLRKRHKLLRRIDQQNWKLSS